MLIFFHRMIFVFVFFISLSVQAEIELHLIDPTKLIPENLLREALDYYSVNNQKIANKKFLTIIDFKVHNSQERFFLVDMDSGYVETYLTAHGKNSDPDYDGFATKFSNTNNSNMTSLGFYLTAETYNGSNGYSLRLDGLSSTNSNARSRAIVIHGADYVTPGSKIGRSFGCPALEMRYHQDIIDRIKGGSLIYAGLSL